MDYGAEFNSDLMGLGKYDKAAMKFSYAGNGYVEVFTDLQYGSQGDPQAPQFRFEAVQYFSGAFGFPSPLSLYPDASGHLVSVNYTTYPDMFNHGIDGLEMRADVPFSDISDDSSSLTGKLKSDTQGRVMVPYFFCSDEFVGNLTCQRFDSGADAYEQAHDLISRYHNFYLLNDFKRDRYTFHSSSAYGTRIASRYFDMLREQLTWYTLLRGDFTDYEYDTPDGLNTFFENPDTGWGSFSVAVSDGFDLFGRVLSQPGAGAYKQVASTDTTDFPITYWKQFSDTSSANTGTRFVPILEGKFVDTTWDFEGCGYYWADQCQTRIGYLLDKITAMDVLTQSQAYFTGRDTATDVRRYAIGYIRPFKNQITEKIGALLAGDYQSLSPVIAANPDKTNRVVFDSWALNNDSTSSTNLTSKAGNIMDPSTGFTMQLYAAVYGLSEFPTTFDQDFVDNTRIFVVGNGEAPVPDATILANSTTDPTKVKALGGAFEWFVWTDPTSGKTYGAHSSAKVGDGGLGTNYRSDTAVRMLSQMSALQAASSSACGGPVPSNTGNAQCNAKYQALLNFKENLDLMRGLHSRYGYARP
jgi:hypothetical protein